ncbi:hypothetical protein [Faecalibacter rhinopitheci]|nr:hypothetical protein [Faecalibacter rhinopitheci]
MSQKAQETNVSELVEKLKDPKHILLRRNNRLKKKRRNNAKS